MGHSFTHHLNFRILKLTSVSSHFQTSQPLEEKNRVEKKKKLKFLVFLSCQVQCHLLNVTVKK